VSVYVYIYVIDFYIYDTGLIATASLIKGKLCLWVGGGGGDKGCRMYACHYDTINSKALL
jgi:hypothetical protein